MDGINQVKLKTSYLQQNENGNSDPYLTALISQMNCNTLTFEHLQKLSFLCERTEFLFDEVNKISSSSCYSFYDSENYVAYHKSCKRFYTNYEDYLSTLFFYKMYLKKLENKLNRYNPNDLDLPIENQESTAIDSFSKENETSSTFSNKTKDIASEVLKCYKKFYTNLKKEGYDIKFSFDELFPSMNSCDAFYRRFLTLVSHCHLNYWLIPLSSVILTRFGSTVLNGINDIHLIGC